VIGKKGHLFDEKRPGETWKHFEIKMEPNEI
jgi:hypothetical protein